MIKEAEGKELTMIGGSQRKGSSMLAALLAFAGGIDGYTIPSTMRNDFEPRLFPITKAMDPCPWAGTHLSKKERKGKTYEEIRELRKRKWEAQNSTTFTEDK